MFSLGLMEVLVILALLGAGVLGVVILFLVVRAITRSKDESS